ncbi:hypothetical protein ACQP36_02595 [Actinobacillus pleuropneumoniae]|uniref:hypothetical protein n=1 Tax=Actinobacillus pleuropneumoniae TaxID=715 RepID=UPI003D067AFF
MIKANNFVNILNATTNIANALGYGGKLFVKSYEFPEGEVKNKEQENETGHH